jgi:hypothetical protein
MARYILGQERTFVAVLWILVFFSADADPAFDLNAERKLNFKIANFTSFR